MKSLKRAALLLAIFLPAAADLPGLLHDMRRSADVDVGLPNDRFIELAATDDGAAPLAPPRALRPDLNKELSVAGRPYRYSTRKGPAPRFGYRANGPADDERRPYALAIGDSFTEAAEVDDEAAYPAVLSRTLGRRVVNLGARRQGLRGHLARLRAVGWLERGPSLVILQLSSNDDSEDDPSPPAGPGLAARFYLGLRQRHPAMTRFIERVATRSGLIRLPSVATPARRDRARKTVGRIRALAAASGARLLVLTHYPEKALEARGWDVDGVLYAPVPHAGFIRLDGHWNEAGHRWVATFLAEELARRGWPEKR